MRVTNWAADIRIRIISRERKKVVNVKAHYIFNENLPMQPVARRRMSKKKDEPSDNKNDSSIIFDEQREMTQSCTWCKPRFEAPKKRPAKCVLSNSFFHF